MSAHQPSFYLRVLRLRWKVLAAFALAGALLAIAFTVLSDRQNNEIEVSYWLGTHKLVLSEEAVSTGYFPNLLQTALQVTGDDIPASVADTLGAEPDELAARVRTVTDTEVNLVEISAVSLDEADAALVADAFAGELVLYLSEREIAAYNAARDEAIAEVDRATTQLATLDADIAKLSITRLELQSELDLLIEAEEAGETPEAEDGEEPRTILLVTAELNDVTEELGRLDAQRSTRATLLEEALSNLDRLQRVGPPASLMTTLDIVPPYTISENAYRERIAQGTRGENNFSARSVPAGASGGLALGETVSNPGVRVGLGIFAGLVLGIGAVLLHLRFDPRLRTKADVEEAFDLPVLAEIPRFPKRDKKTVELHAITRTRSTVTESYRMVRSALVFAKATAESPLVLDASTISATTPPTAGDDPGALAPADLAATGLPAENTSDEMRVVMVTSPGPSEGKTTTTANLAVVLAEAGYEVLVINCDYRLPKLHKFFGLPHEPRRTLPTDIPGVTLVADVTDPGETNPTTVVQAQRALIGKARRRYDVVLLDTAPLLATNDALSLLPVVDLVLLVAAEGKTDREAATETVDLLRRRRANIAGVVLTGASGFGRSRYYYQYRYGMYYDKSDEKPTVPVNDLDLSDPSGQLPDHAPRRARTDAVGAATASQN